MSNCRHGMHGSRLYGVWNAMLARCTNKNVAAFVNYGGRGITVCERWKTFKCFYDDMGEPNDGKTLDRIDNNKGYCKENCRWVDRKTQGRNKRNNRILVVNGISRTMSEWAENSGLKLATIWARIKKGWSETDAVITPLITIRSGIKRGTKLHKHERNVVERSVKFSDEWAR